MIRHAVVIALLCAGCGFDGGYRYPCQNPDNWQTDDCQSPRCDVWGTCPDQLVLVPERQHVAFHRPAVKTAVILGAGVLFIEYKKAENIEPEPHQLREHERMRAVGADVRVIGSKEQVDALIQELFPS